MFKLPRNRLYVGKNSRGTPLAFTAEHVVSMVQNDYAAHIVFVRLDSGESLIVEHNHGLCGVLEGFDISLASSFFGEQPPEKAA